MRAIVIKEFGAPQGLALVDLPDLTPGEEQVVIATEAIGVGGVDTMIRSGALGGYGFEVGHVLGGEVAGTVTSVGSGVDASRVGQRVWAHIGTQGGYAERAVAPVGALVPIPSGLSSVEAVTIGSSGAVAHFALRHAHFAPGEAVLVRGAAGGIGVMAVQLAARSRAGVVAVTTSSPVRGERLKQLGATKVFNRAGEGGEDTADGYDIIVDIVGGADLPSFFRRLNPNGRMVSVGIVGGPPPADFAMEMFAAFQKSMSFATFSANADCVPEADRLAVIAELFAATLRGEMQAVVHEVLPLEQAGLAHEKMDGGEVFGRIALTP